MTTSWPGLRRAAAEITAEAGGVYAVLILTPDRALAMMAAAVEGDRDALRYAIAISECLKRIEIGRDRPLCLTCERQFSTHRLPSTFVLLHAGRDDAKTAIVNGLCLACASVPDLQERVLDYYRKNLVPGLRVLPPLSAGSPTPN